MFRPAMLDYRRVAEIVVGKGIFATKGEIWKVDVDPW